MKIDRRTFTKSLAKLFSIFTAEKKKYREIDAVEFQPAEGKRVRACVLQFEKFIFIPVSEANVRRLKHDFRDEQFAQVLRREKCGFDQRAPDSRA